MSAEHPGREESPDGDFDLELMRERIGRFRLEQRLRMQAVYASHIFGPGLLKIHIENMLWLHFLMRLGLRACGLYRRGQRNAADFRVVQRDVGLPDLPAAFDGFTLLHLSDLHVDMNRDVADALVARLRGLRFDAAALTGDYRSLTHGPYDRVLAGMARVRAALDGPVYAVLGNHDWIETVPPMEAGGIRVLLNEGVRLERGGAALWLAGVDDPHFYESDNLEKAVAGVGPGETVVLLCHTPELFRQAAYGGVDLMLCGHTHGGQLCLPGGRAVLTNARAPRALCRGGWRYESLQGYTTRGCGVSGVDVRYNCPPELVLHRLRRAPAAA